MNVLYFFVLLLLICSSQTSLQYFFSWLSYILVFFVFITIEEERGAWNQVAQSDVAQYVGVHIVMAPKPTVIFSSKVFSCMINAWPPRFSSLIHNKRNQSLPPWDFTTLGDEPMISVDHGWHFMAILLLLTDLLNLRLACNVKLLKA